jgi:hypothetical protein
MDPVQKRDYPQIMHNSIPDIAALRRTDSRRKNKIKSRTGALSTDVIIVTNEYL